MFKRTVFRQVFNLKNMTRTYIAFIECVFRPLGQWQEKTSRDMFVPKGEDAEIALVDIKSDRCYFRALDHGTLVRIVNNTVVFESEDYEELTINESKQFPKNKRIDE
jgi:hypothetical protein